MYRNARERVLLLRVVALALVILATGFIVLLGMADSYKGPAEISAYTTQHTDSQVLYIPGLPQSDSSEVILDEKEIPLAAFPGDFASESGATEYALIIALIFAAMLFAGFKLSDYFNERSRAIWISKKIRREIQSGKRKL